MPTQTAKHQANQSWSKRLTYELPQLKLYLVNEARTKRPWPSITSAEDAAKLLKPLTYASEEHFVSLHLNAKFEVIGLHEVSHGTLSASLVHPREVFKSALVANSYAILVCHNHPSGSRLKASPEDLETTRQLVKAGKILGVSLLDHIILGPEELSSEELSSEELSSEELSSDDSSSEDSSSEDLSPPPALYSLRQEHPELWAACPD
jgi:DNA repair protein RadC